MKYRPSVFGLLIASLGSLASAGIELTTGSGRGPQRLAESGQSPSGCPDPSLNSRAELDGKWLALTDTTLRRANPYVIDNQVTSGKSDEKFFFSEVPLHAGVVHVATTEPIRTGTTARTELEIKLGAARYRFIEWGAFTFALQTLTVSGGIKSTEVYSDVDSLQAIPKDAYVVTSRPRTSEDPGTLDLIRAGDFNNDGVVDLLLRYEDKEAGGLILWLSEPGSERHQAPIVSATWYGDC
jgi:hypothetical protein